MEKKVVCCLFGGRSSEYEVSLLSVSSVLENIDRDKYDVITVGITKDGKWLLYEGGTDKIRNGSWCEDAENMKSAFVSPCYGENALIVLDGDKSEKLHVDLVFPVLHGANGEDGTLQGLLQLSGIPFVGPPCDASAVAMDKALTKLVLKNFAIPQARALMVNSYELEKTMKEILFSVEALGYPVFVKPASTGSSVGVTKVNESASLEAAIRLAAVYCPKVIIEEAIVGSEIEVAVMGNNDPIASVCGEINPGTDFYDYDTKYNSDTASYFIPARIDPDVAQKVRKYAVKIYRALGCRGLSRVDFFVGQDGKITFNEINTLPGFTPISMYPKLFMHDGMSYSDVIDKVIEYALEQ